MARLNQVNRCPTCGRPLDEHDRHVRFQRPDAVFQMSEADLEGKVWGDDPLLAVKDVGYFVRTLLPVKLTGGYTVTYGVWLAVAEGALHQAWQVWHAPGYGQLRIEGDIANALPPWGTKVLGKHVRTEVRDTEQIPYACESRNPLVTRILTEEWQHDEVLRSLPT